MEEVDKIWQDGQLKNWHDAQTHVLSHTLHYGAGVFEGIRFYKTDRGSAVFRLKEHLDRLFYSASVIELKIPFSAEALQQAVLLTIRANKIEQGYIRPLAYYGYGKMGLNPTGAASNVFIAAWPWASYLGDKAIKVKTSSYIRIHPKTTICDAKLCGNYLNSILASQEVHKAGFDESLFLDYAGKVAEGPGENIFMIKNGQIVTPAKGSILPGITRNSIMTLVEREWGGKVIEKDITLDELKTADEVFFTGTAAEVTPIAQIDATVISGGQAGPMTEKIRSLFLDVVHGRKANYADWLTMV